MSGPVVVLAVPDGAAEALSARPTALEQAATPTLDRLAAQGRVRRVRTIPRGLAAGTEVGVPTLLGVRLATAPSRGRLEAAAAGVALGADEGAWRLDLLPGTRPDAGGIARLAAGLAPLGARVRHLGGHRLLLTGPAAWGDAPPGPHQTSRPLAALAGPAFAAVAALAVEALGGVPAWPWGRLGSAAELPDLTALLGRPVVVVAQGGAPAGVAGLLGCDLVRAAPGAGAAVAADAEPGSLVVIHDPRPDEAAHCRDRAGKVAAVEAFDRDVVAPARAVVAARGGVLVVCPDHGCDPRSGRHGRDPVPAVVWQAAAAPGGAAPGDAAPGG
ncbi:MAG TPA: hypothetical protein VM324_08450, partial [Egibacteraceae bacterium]|nr:hypothetical protein [Egibacteraceae bacterium]